MPISYRYLNRTSSTLVAIINIFRMLTAIWGLYQLIHYVVENVGSVSSISDQLDEILNTLRLQGAAIDPLLSKAIFTVSTLVIVVVAAFFVIAAISLLLMLIDSIALLTLRFGHRGANVVKAVHRTYSIFYYVIMILFAVLDGYFIYGVNTSRYLSNTDSYTLTLVFVITGVVVLLILLVIAFYEADIAKAMKTVDHEVDTDCEDVDFRRTHLSGISFIIGILMAIYTVVNFVPFIGQLSMGADPTSIITAVIAVLYTIKQFAICFCYRNLKHARL